MRAVFVVLLLAAFLACGLGVSLARPLLAARYVQPAYPHERELVIDGGHPALWSPSGAETAEAVQGEVRKAQDKAPATSLLALWQPKHERAPGHAMHVVTLGLRHHNEDKLEEWVMRVSDPDSDEYRQYPTDAELAEVIGATDEELAVVEEVLKSAGASSWSVSQHRDVVRVELTVEALERLFVVEMEVFERTYARVHRKALERMPPRVVYRSRLPAFLPKKLLPLVATVHGVSDLPLMKRMGAPDLDEMPMRAAMASEITAAKSPVVTMAAARPPVAGVEFTPVCVNGKQSHALPPCSDEGDAVVSITLQARSASAAHKPFESYTIDDISKSDEVTCSLASSDKVAVCRAMSTVWPDLLPMYTPMQLGVSVTFSSSATSAAGWNQYPTARGPMITPRDIARRYNIPQSWTSTSPGNSQCVVEFEQQYFDMDDLIMYMRDQGRPFSADQVTVIGPNDESNPGVEALLDIEVIMGVAPNVSTVFWSIKANSTAEIDDILTWQFAIANMTAAKRPLVNSLSYGMTAENVDKYLGSGYLARSDAEFKKMATLGVSILIASGDTGSSDLGAEPMGHPTCGTKLWPDWPSQSPYVTAVGATFITPYSTPGCYGVNGSATQPQYDCAMEPLGDIGVSLHQGIGFTTGSGFADRTARPAYQDRVVQEWLQVAGARGQTPPSTWFNAKGRAYNDVTLVGWNWAVASKGAYLSVGGTSASSPGFAAILSILNDAQLNNGAPPLGFVNPLLYKLKQMNPATFDSVTVGQTSTGAYGWSPLECDFGMTAAETAWNPVGGLGVPNVGQLLAALS